MSTNINLEYRGPEDFTVIYDDQVMTAMEAAELMEHAAQTLVRDLLSRGMTKTQETVQ